MDSRAPSSHLGDGGAMKRLAELQREVDAAWRNRQEPELSEGRPVREESDAAVAAKRLATEEDLHRLRREALALREGLTRELEAKRAQLRALDEELAAQKQRMEEEVRAHAAGLMIEVEQKRATLQALENEVLQQRITLSELKVQEGLRRQEAAAAAARPAPRDRLPRDPQQPLPLVAMPAGGAAAQEAVRQEERRLQADRMVQLELECGRLSHALQKEAFKMKELEKALAQAKDLASAAEEDRDRKAAEVATLTRALTDLRDRAVAVRERQRRGGGPDLPGPPPGLSAGPCGPAGLGVIREVLDAQLGVVEQCEAVAQDAAQKARTEAEDKLRAQGEALRTATAVVQESERMRALLEATLKAENAARLQAEDRARALEQQLESLQEEVEGHATKLLEAQRGAEDLRGDLELRLQAAEARCAEAERRAAELSDALRRAEVEAAELRGCQAAETASRERAEAPAATEDAAQQQQSLALPMAEQEATQQRLEEARAALQLAEAELEVERAEGRRVAQELAEAQSRLAHSSGAPAEAPQALALRESEALRGRLEATLQRENEAKREAEGRVRALEVRLQETQGEAEGRLVTLMEEQQRNERREEAERRAMQLEMARLEAEQRYQEASHTVAQLQEEVARLRAELQGKVVVGPVVPLSEAVSLQEKVKALLALEKQLRGELREQEAVNTRTQALIREELQARIQQLERQLLVGRAPGRASGAEPEGTLQKQPVPAEPLATAEQACRALEGQVAALSGRVQEQRRVEQQLKDQLREHDLLSTRAQALVREEMQAKVEQLQRQLAALHARAVPEVSETAVALKLTEKRLKEKELAHRRLGFQLQDREVELAQLTARLGHREDLEAELSQARRLLATREEEAEALLARLRREELLRKEQLIHAVCADGADEGRAVQEYLGQLDREVTTVRAELRAQREALEAAHLRGLRQHEALTALDAEQHARRLELAALGDEVAAKRETALRLIAEPAEGRVAALVAERQALEGQLATLRAAVQAAQAEDGQARLTLQGVAVEARQTEAGLLDKRRQLTALGQQVEDVVAQLRVVEADLQLKRRQRLQLVPGDSALTQAEDSAVPLLRASVTAHSVAKSTPETPSLLLTVLDAQDLVPIDHAPGRPNPFLVVQFGVQARQTAVLHSTLDPCWDETFEFPAEAGRMELMVWDDELGRRRESMGTGHLVIDEALLQAARQGPVKKWVPLLLRAHGDAGGINVVVQARGPPGALAAPTSRIVAATQIATTQTSEGPVVAFPSPVIKSLAQPAPMLVATDQLTAKPDTAVEITAPAPPAEPAPPPPPKVPKAEVVTLDAQPTGPYVDYAETTSQPPSLHFKEPDVKYLRIRLLEGVVPMMDWDGLCDPYVCVDTGLMRWESAVIKETLTPGWYQEAVLGCYHLRRRHEWGLQLPEDLAQEDLQLTVYDWNMTKDRRIGYVRLRLCDIPGYEGDDPVDPPAPHWYEAERHFGVLTTVVNSDFGQWVGSFMQDDKTKACLKLQRRKVAVINALKSGIGHLGHKARDLKCDVQAALGHPEATAGDPTARQVPAHLFKTEEERRLEAIIPEDLPDDDPLARGDRNLCSVKAQIWFDNTYTPPPAPILGQLHLKLHSVALLPRANGQPRAPLVVLHYDRHWVRLPTVVANTTSVFDQEFLFGITEPSATLTLAVFDDCSDRVLSKEPKFQGLLRIRPACLGSNERYTTTLPLHRRHKGDVMEHGRVSFSVTLRLQNVAPIIVAMFKPPMKAAYYYAPLTEFTTTLATDGPMDFETPIRTQQYRRLLQLMGKQPGWSAKVLPHVAPPPVPQFDFALLLANFKRLKEGFRGVVNFAHYLEYICLWTNWRESVGVNALLVALIWLSEWIPTAVLLALLWSFAHGFLRRQRGAVVVPMEAELFGKVLNRPEGEAAPPNMEGDSDHEEDAAEDDEKETSAWEDIQKLVGVATTVQEVMGTMASFVERVESLPKWRDPRISGLLSVVFVVLIPGLYYVPLRLVLSGVVLFVLRHPALRDPIPPPPANLLLRLPTRAPLLLPRSAKSKLAFIDPNAS